MQKPVERYRIARRPLPLPEEQPHMVQVAADGFEKPPSTPKPRSHISFVEQEQRNVNRLRTEMTPRITKEIAKAFNRVRYGCGSKKKKVMDRILCPHCVRQGVGKPTRCQGGRAAIGMHRAGAGVSAAACSQ